MIDKTGGTGDKARRGDIWILIVFLILMMMAIIIPVFSMAIRWEYGV